MIDHVLVEADPALAQGILAPCSLLLVCRNHDVGLCPELMHVIDNSLEVLMNHLLHDLLLAHVGHV